jgi:hypothetical protein
MAWNMVSLLLVKEPLEPSDIKCVLGYPSDFEAYSGYEDLFPDMELRAIFRFHFVGGKEVGKYVSNYDQYHDNKYQREKK